MNEAFLILEPPGWQTIKDLNIAEFLAICSRHNVTIKKIWPFPIYLRIAVRGNQSDIERAMIEWRDKMSQLRPPWDDEIDE